MITKTIALLLSMSLVLNNDTTSTPTVISVDIEFCDVNKAFEKSICSIQETENGSNNRLFLDQKENLQAILIDKRSITYEKAIAIFEDGYVFIEEQSIINLPYLRKSILIRPGEYKVEQLRRGFKIHFN